VDLSFCQLLHNCSAIDTAQCPDCLSGNADCTPAPAQCWIQGQCDGNMIHIEKASSPEVCLGKCQETKGCRWFTFMRNHNVEEPCVLLRDCYQLDPSCDTCTSGERRCHTESTTVSTTTTLTTTSETITGLLLQLILITFISVIFINQY
jgi:hypothetical protein